MLEFIQSVIKPEKISEDDLKNRSVPYEDAPIELEQKLNLYINTEGVPMLVDRDTGKIFRKKFEFNLKAVEVLRDKLGMNDKVATEVKTEENIEETAKPKITVKEKEPIMN